MRKNSKIYVAGHQGMVGSAITRALKEKGFYNLILKTHQQLDLLDQRQVRDLFAREKPEYVILAAAKVGGIKANIERPADFLYENLMIQNNVIWQAHLSGVRKLLFLASSCAYPRQSKQPMKEEYLLTGELEPTNEGYALAKICGLKLGEKIYEQFGQKFVGCMPTNIYGPGDNFSNDSSHVIPALIRRMHEAKVKKAGEVVIWGSGQSRREFMYVDDLAQAVSFLLQNYDEPALINVGTGSDVTIRELAQQIKTIVGYKGRLVFDQTKPDGMPRKKLDVSRMKKLGWQAETPLKEGLQKAYEYYLKNYS